MTNKILVLLLTCFSITANAKLLFEGYRKIELKGKHIGFVVQKDEVDDTTKLRTVTYLVWENIDGHVSQDAYQLVAKPAPAPALWTGVKFTNWNYNDDEGTIATGEFTKAGLKVKKVVANTGEKIEESSGTREVPANAIYSTMATTVFAESNPAKYVRGAKATYEALDESEQKFGELEMEVLETKSFGDQKISQVLAELRNSRYDLYTFADGQTLGYRDSFSDRIDYLVNRREDAFGEFQASEAIKKIFGDVPRGLHNPVSESQGKINAKEIIESFVSLKARAEQKHKKR